MTLDTAFMRVLGEGRGTLSDMPDPDMAAVARRLRAAVASLDKALAGAQQNIVDPDDELPVEDLLRSITHAVAYHQDVQREVSKALHVLLELAELAGERRR